jgi:hypothetical protein
LNNGRSNAEQYLKVSQHGMTIGSDTKKLIESFNATIDLSKLRFCNQVRFGNPPQYRKTYDGRKTADGSGQPWSDTLALAKSVDSSRASDPYDTAEMLIVVAADVKSVKGEDSVKAGTKLGYTPPYTGAPQIGLLLDAVTAAGGDVNTSIAKVKVGYEAIARNGNNWGIVTFTFDGLVEE